jgi:hypothetical protein
VAVPADARVTRVVRRCTTMSGSSYRTPPERAPAPDRRPRLLIDGVIMRPTNLFRTLTAVVLFSAPLSAQGRVSPRATTMPSSDREGYSLSLGLGGGSSGVTCAGCDDSRETGASGYFRIGKGMSPTLILGAELNGWNKTENLQSARTGMVSAIAQWYPSVTNGFFAKAGLGVGRTTLTDKSVTPTDKLESTGLGYQLGMGYDIGIARRWSITPYMNYLATNGANAHLNGVDMNTKLDANYVQYGLGLSWH